LALLQSTMKEGIRNLLFNLKKVTLPNGSKVAFGIDWAKVVVPREQEGNGVLGSESPDESGQLSDTSVVATEQQAETGQLSDTSGSAAATQQPEESGQLFDASVVATEQRVEPGHLSDTSGAATQQPEESGQLSDTSVVATEQRVEPGQLSDTSGAATQQPAETGQLLDTSAAVERGSPKDVVEAGEARPTPPPTSLEPVQGAEPIKATGKGKGRGKKSTKRQKDTTMDTANLGQLPVTECAGGGTEVKGENGSFQSPPNPDPPKDVEQEQEISAETDTLGSTILGFQPLNPENSPERRPDHYLPTHTSTPGQGHSNVTGENVLWISGLRSDTPIPDAESGVESNASGENPGDSSLPPRQERPPQSNLNKIITAAMKKGRPVCDLRDVLGLGLDPRDMPTNPENAPHSLLDHAVARSRQNQSDKMEGRLRSLAVSRPVELINVSRPVEPDSTHCKEAPQTKEEVEDRIQQWIRRAKIQKQTSQIQSPTGQQNVHDTPQTSTSSGGTGRGKKKNRTRITGPVQTRNIRDRLGPPLNLVFTSKLGATPWNRQIEGLEPEEGLEPGDPKEMTQQELIDEVIRLRSIIEEKDPESTDDSEEEQK
jgi:hypothetical protein